MRTPRHNPHGSSPLRTNLGVPATQSQALDRRQALDAQQRTFRTPGTSPAPTRPPRPA